MEHAVHRRRLPTTIAFRRKLFFSVVVTVTVLAAIEFACRLVVRSSTNERWRHHANLVVTIGFEGLNEILEPDPERFWRLRPNITKRLEGEIAGSRQISFFVSTDKHGHRRTAELSSAAHTVLFLGDSCTFGVGVDDDQTFASLLQDRLPATRCLNAGVPGYSAFQGRRLLESVSNTDPPNVVVVSFLFNDNSQWDQLSDSEHAAVLDSVAARLARHSRFAAAFSTLKGQRVTAADKARRPRLTDEEYFDELEKIVERCGQLGSRTIFLIWPQRRQMPSGAAITKQDVMRYVAKQHGIPVVDLVPAFQQNGDVELFVDVVHANAAGHQLVAKAIEPVLRELVGASERRSSLEQVRHRSPNM